MFDTIETYTAMPFAARELCAYVEEHRDALLNAAAVLGGQAGVRLAQTAIDGLHTETPSRRTETALADLLDRLMLENVHDSDRIEAARFAMLDPESPVVEEICLLADRLDDAMASYRLSLDKTLAQQVAA